jgi:hypothetical protein
MGGLLIVVNCVEKYYLIVQIVLMIKRLEPFGSFDPFGSFMAT